MALKADYFFEFMASSPIATMILDASGEILFSNLSCQRLLCFEKHELESLMAPQLLATLNYDGLEALVAKALKCPDAPSITRRGNFVNRFGISFESKVSIQNNLIGDQRFISIYFETEFSSLAKKSAFSRINVQIENLIKTAPLPIVAANRKGEITTWNPACEQLFGWKNDEVIGRRTPWVSEDKVEQANWIYEKVTKGEVVVDFRTKRRSKSGRDIDVSIWAFPLYDSEGELSNVGGVIFDLTEQTHLERFLRKAKEDAELASTAKNVFLATISHEIRTPLAAILGAAELMRIKKDDVEAQLNIIHRNGTHLLSLIDDVLDLTKIEAQQLTMTKTVFCPAEELDSAVAAVKAKAEQKGLSLTVINDPSAPTNFFSDATRFRQVIINLLNNAIKFTREGGLTVSLKLENEDGNSYLSTVVEDTGLGINEAEREKIFSLFTQGKIAGLSRSDGAGVGLTLSKKIALNLGGDLELLKSELGRGSTFRFKLPFDQLSSESQRILAPRKKVLDLASKPLSGLSILVVDDCEDLCSITSELLRSAGANTTAAASGYEALDLVAERSFDLILMDIEMPGMNGFETTTRLRRQGYTNRIAALTAHALLEERQYCLDAGCDTYISKPINFAKLVETISQLTQS